MKEIKTYRNMQYTEGSQDANDLCEIFIDRAYTKQRERLQKESLEKIESSLLPRIKKDQLSQKVKTLWRAKECGHEMQHDGWGDISGGTYIEIYPGCAVTKDLLDEEGFCNYILEEISKIKCPCEV